jgi:hypothetical protein
VALLALGAFVGSSFIAVPTAQSKMGVGVSWSEAGGVPGSVGTTNPSPIGLVGKLGIGNIGAIQGTLQHSGSDLGDYTRLATEFQFTVNSSQNAKFYTGGGFTYTSSGTLTEDPMAIYAPVGFEYSIQNSPVSLTAGSSFSYVLEDGFGDSGIEFFDDVTIGAIYYFN